MSEQVQGHETVQSGHAEYTSASDDIAETNRQLQVKRPPTAPADDLSRERELILRGPGIDILMIQIALFVSVLSLLSFLVLSRETAQGMTLLLLCSGVAIGFFLRK